MDTGIDTPPSQEITAETLLARIQQGPFTDDELKQMTSEEAMRWLFAIAGYEHYLVLFLSGDLHYDSCRMVFNEYKKPLTEDDLFHQHVRPNELSSEDARLEVSDRLLRARWEEAEERVKALFELRISPSSHPLGDDNHTAHNLLWDRLRCVSDGIESGNAVIDGMLGELMADFRRRHPQVEASK